jgi:hypothetical protein
MAAIKDYYPKQEYSRIGNFKNIQNYSLSKLKLSKTYHQNVQKLLEAAVSSANGVRKPRFRNRCKSTAFALRGAILCWPPQNDRL